MNKQLSVAIRKHRAQRRMVAQIEKRFGGNPKSSLVEEAESPRLPVAHDSASSTATQPAATQPAATPPETPKEKPASEKPTASTVNNKPKPPSESATQVQNLYDELLSETGEQLAQIANKFGDKLSTGTKKGEDTMALYSMWNKNRWVGWTPERLAWQNQTLTKMELEQGERNGRMSPKKKQVVVLAGLPGAGKTHIRDTVLSEQFDMRDYITVDTDDIKTKLVETGDVPKTEGFQGMQLAPLVHEESESMAHRWVQSLMHRGVNMVIDILAANPESTLRLVESLKQAGYEVSMVYVEVTPIEAAVSVLRRFKEGGRPVPPSYVRALARGTEGNVIAEAMPRYKEAINGNFWHYRSYPVSQQSPILVEGTNKQNNQTPEPSEEPKKTDEKAAANV